MSVASSRLNVLFFRGCPSPLRSPWDAPDSEGVRFIIQQAHQQGKLYIAIQGAMTNPWPMEPSINLRSFHVRM